MMVLKEWRPNAMSMFFLARVHDWLGRPIVGGYDGPRQVNALSTFEEIETFYLSSRQLARSGGFEDDDPLRRIPRLSTRCITRKRADDDEALA